jgi:hypothetical protein
MAVFYIQTIQHILIHDYFTHANSQIFIIRRLVYPVPICNGEMMMMMMMMMMIIITTTKTTTTTEKT